MILKAVRNKTLAGPFLYCIQDEQGRTVAGANSPELARLIEAMPVLLDACKATAALASGQGRFNMLEVAGQARAAITQATSV